MEPQKNFLYGHTGGKPPPEEKDKLKPDGGGLPPLNEIN